MSHEKDKETEKAAGKAELNGIKQKRFLINKENPVLVDHGVLQEKSDKNTQVGYRFMIKHDYEV